MGQLYLPPPGSIFVLVPITALASPSQPHPAPTDATTLLPTDIASRIRQLYDDHDTHMVAFATIPEAIYHAHQVATFRVTLTHIDTRASPPGTLIDLSTSAACGRQGLRNAVATTEAIRCGMWLVSKQHPCVTAPAGYHHLPIPMHAADSTVWEDRGRGADAPPLTPGAAALDWAKERFSGRILRDAARWLRRFTRITSVLKP